MIIVHLALGGCLRTPPVKYGVTADTGGHIAYVLDAALHQSQMADVSKVIVVTRLFEAPGLDPIHACAVEHLSDKLTVHRITSASRCYLEKDALEAELPAFAEAFCAELATWEQLPDVIHAHFADAAAVAIHARATFGIPLIYTPHGLGIDKRQLSLTSPGLERRIEAERQAISEAAGIIVSSRNEAERQVGSYGVTVGDRLHTVVPGVPGLCRDHDATSLLDNIDEWLEEPNLPIILAIARPVRKKNLISVLRAYAADRRLQLSANVVILAGQHGYAAREEQAVLDELHALANTPALRGRVAMPVAHTQNDVAALYHRAALGGVFVNPALHEPFGLTLLEAAAFGVPVVATRNGGPADIVANLRHGVLVDPNDTDNIAAALRGILLDPELHATYSRAGRHGIGAYCWHRYATRSVEIYRRACDPRLLASDIDATLTGCAQSARAFAQWRAGSSLPFIVATGRDFAAALSVLESWGLPLPDAFIVDVGTRLMLADGVGGWTECEAYRSSLEADWSRVDVVACVAALGIQPQPPQTAGPHKQSYFGSAEDAVAIRGALAARGLRAQVIFSHGRLIDVIAERSGKARAVAAYAKRLGLSLSHCIAAGDSGNDADMLAGCGHAILVGNADAALDALPARAGLYRATRAHAAGVLEGLSLLGLAPVTSDDVRAAAA